MFLKPSIFKAMCSSAYKTSGLQIEHHADGVYAIGSSWWQVEVKDSMLSNKIKAIIVELIGDFPLTGEGYTYRKGEDGKCSIQMEIEGTIYQNLEKCYGISQEIYESTPLYITQTNVLCNILQNIDTGDKTFINAMYLNLIDCDQIDYDAGECAPEGIHASGNTLIWSNNVMSFRCYVRSMKYKGEVELLEIFKTADLLYDRSGEGLIDAE